jgi:hypothetical protein
MALKDNKHRELYGDLNRVGKGSIEPEAYRKLQDKQTVTDYHKWLKNQIKAAATAKTHKS